MYAYPPLQTDPGFVQTVASYWSIVDMTPEVLRKQLHDVTSAIISSDNSTSFVVINVHGAASNAPLQPALAAYKKLDAFITYLIDKHRMASINPDHLDVKITGMRLDICTCTCNAQLAQATT